LTQRQRDVLQHLLAGLADKAIASELRISPHTVHNHVKALYRTFGVSSRPELFARCLELHAEGKGDPTPGAWPAPPDSARMILAHAPDFILELERDGTIRFINRVYPIHRREDVIGTNVADWIAPEEWDAYRQALEAVFETGEPQAFEHTIPSVQEMDIAPRYQVRLGPVEENGRVVRAIGVVREILQPADVEK
jgi:PAS domain S-box-containing protein